MDTGPARTTPPGAVPRRRWPLWLLAGVVAVAAVGGLVAAVVLGGAERSTPGTLLPTAGPTPTIAPGDTAAVFLGDSYTQGWGASEPGTRWSALVADGAGWVEVNQGQGGTGFVTTSGLGGCGLDYCPTYPERVPDVVAVQPDIVLIAGGQNDLSALAADPDAVRAAVDETYTRIREGLPQARIIAVGPSTAQPGNALIAELDGWVQAAAASVGADYVSLIDPVVIEPEMVDTDGVHVNDAGHRAIAERVLAGIGAR
ncbi:SGNH/GDSL hydrolase family protein [Cryobacterium sp. 1639]|uniref:SGNH/GDSL hydrolase family protein n=1 Tax=Cryobacterium inferilacus TaxID=2866629 RepID=UPI001C72D6B8|nr:SGNH/GDSL hydrolase family protein [Cryobacterium sp. 1639]MBX0299860.1 SGNH/GDSL hydrolase family protein [Cryobacterium sp. 1639]